MMLGVLTWLLGSKIGRYAALGFLTFLIITSVVAVFYRKGANAEKQKQQTRRLETIRDAIEIRRDVQTMSPNARRKELSEWVR